MKVRKILDTINFSQSLIEGKEREQLTMSFFAEAVAIRLAWPLPDSDSKKVSRFLAKAGIETLYLKMKEYAYDKDFDFVRRYARFGGKKDFVPFLWCNWQHQDIDLYVGKLELGKKEIFYFGTVVLPGIVYLIPLNRCDDTYAIGEMKHCMKVGGNRGERGAGTGISVRAVWGIDDQDKGIKQQKKEMHMPNSNEQKAIDDLSEASFSEKSFIIYMGSHK